MKTSCEIVKDLLPLYHDNVCSEESRAMVEEHIKICSSCSKILDSISDELAYPKNELDDTKPIKAIKKAWKRDRSKAFIVGGIITAVLLITAAVIYAFNYGIIGVSADKVESHARKGHNICESWEMTMAANESIVAMLFYNETLDEHTFSIYTKHPGLSFGYFFQSGGSDSGIEWSFFARQYDLSGGTVLLSMNNVGIARIDYDDGVAITNINIDPAKPFALIVPVSISQVKMYDASGIEMRNWDEYPSLLDIDLTNDGPISVIAEYISNYRLYTNSTKISVVVSGDSICENASIALYDAEGSVEIMVMQIRADKRSGEFTNLTSAKNYFIVPTGLDGCMITLSD